MANIIETDNWPGGVYQYADGDVLEGGPDSSEVLPFKQLAQRSLYQRLRNVTDWDVGLAAGFGYPAGAVVRHAGVSWRSKVGDNDVEPGTDPAAWERWGYSESELNERLAALLPYGAPVACPNSGPAGAADKSKVHKSAHGEYWMWLGDAWQVVCGRYGIAGTNTAVYTGNITHTLLSLTTHREAAVALDLVAGCVGQSSGHTIDVKAWVNGVMAPSTPATASGAGSNIGSRVAHTRVYPVNTLIQLTLSTTVTVSVGWNGQITFCG